MPHKYKKMNLSWKTKTQLRKKFVLEVTNILVHTLAELLKYSHEEFTEKLKIGKTQEKIREGKNEEKNMLLSE